MLVFKALDFTPKEIFQKIKIAVETFDSVGKNWTLRPSCKMKKNPCYTVVLSKGTMLQFRRFFDVSNMTFSTFNTKFDIGTNIKVNNFSREMIF